MGVEDCIAVHDIKNSIKLITGTLECFATGRDIIKQVLNLKTKTKKKPKRCGFKQMVS
jgi:hypothetical protein